MNRKEIRCDLYDIRYYQTHRAMFEKPGLKIVKNLVEEKIKRYGETAKRGGVILHALYSQLYEVGNTQKEAAEKWQVSEWYVKYLHQKLMAYLEKNLSEE